MMCGIPKLAFEIVGEISVKAADSISHHPVTYFCLRLILSDFTNLVCKDKERCFQSSRHIIFFIYKWRLFKVESLLQYWEPC